MTFIPLDYADLALAALLVVVNGVLSIVFDLRLARPLFVATVRMVIQLLLVGLILTTVFEIASAWWTLLIALLMVLFAGREVLARQKRRLTGWWAYGLGTSTMMVAATFVTLLALTTQIRPDPWFDPRFSIPLLGMILGNAMTGISLGLDTLTNAATQQKLAIEAQLALGATRREAMIGVMRDALRSGLMPMINSMSATGLVFLPGMMTGQILAGIQPAEAVKYQLLIMFLIAGATGLGVLMAVFGAMYRITDERHRLRLDRLRAVREN